MTNDARSNRRRSMIVDRDFQVRFGLRLGGAMLLFLLPYLLVAWLIPRFAAGDADAPEWARAQMETFLGTIFVPLAITFVFLFVHGLRESFRIAGPAYRFRRVFEDVRSLRIPSGVRLRKGDYLQETAAEFGETLETLQGEVVELRDLGREASEAVARARDGDDGSLEAAAAAVDRLQARLGRFELLGPAPENRPLEPAEAPAEAPDGEARMVVMKGDRRETVERSR